MASVFLTITASSLNAADADVETQLDEVVLLLREQNFEDALKNVGKVLHDFSLSDEELARALRYQGTAYLLSGQHGEALAIFSSALDIRPNDPWLLWRRCEVNGIIGYFASARRDCSDARRFLYSPWNSSMDPVRADYLSFSIALSEAEVHRKLGSQEKAIANLEKIEVSQTLASVDWRRHEKLATLYFDVENFEMAVKNLDAAMDGSQEAPTENRAFLHFVRAASYNRLQQQDEAALDFAEAIELAPTNELYLFRGCNFALTSQNRNLADKACTRLETLYPDKTLYQRTAAINEALSGRFAEALSRFGGFVISGQADLDLLGAIFEATAYAASCNHKGATSPCSVSESK